MFRGFSCLALFDCEGTLAMFSIARVRITEADILRSLYKTSKLFPATERAGKAGLQRCFGSAVVATWCINTIYKANTNRFKCFVFPQTQNRFCFPLGSITIQYETRRYFDAGMNSLNSRHIK